MEPTYWEVRKWRKQKEAQIKGLKTRLHQAEQELKNLVKTEAKKEAVEEAYLLINF